MLIAATDFPAESPKVQIKVPGRINGHTGLLRQQTAAFFQGKDIIRTILGKGQQQHYIPFLQLCYALLQFPHVKIIQVYLLQTPRKRRPFCLQLLPVELTYRAGILNDHDTFGFRLYLDNGLQGSAQVNVFHYACHRISRLQGPH